MKERSFDEMIAYFNRRVADMDINQDYKMELLGMVTALGYKHEKSAQPMRKKGKWIEKHHAYSDEESVIEEWQSCCCSECGRYDTRPYMYYFSEPNYCSWCGADMRGEHGTDEE